MKCDVFLRLSASVLAICSFSSSVQGAAVYPSEIAYYSLDGNVNNSIGAGLYTGVVNGVPAYGIGFNQAHAFSFNGGRTISTTTTANLGIEGGSFTVDAWVNLSFPTFGTFSIFGTPSTGITDQGLELIEQNDKPYFGFFHDDTPGNTALAANTWYNIAWVYDSATGTQATYVNGSLDVSSAGHSNFTGTAVATIGGSCCGSNMFGLIEDVAVFDAALTQAQVQGLIAPEPSPLTSIDMLFGMGSVAVIFRCRKAACTGAGSILRSFASVTSRLFCAGR